MSAMLDSLLDTQRRKDCAANETPPMRPFVIQIKNGSTVRLEFAAMAPDSLTAAEQHECMCERHEYVRVIPSAIASDEAREAMRQQQALYRQVDAQMRDPVLSHLYD